MIHRPDHGPLFTGAEAACFLRLCSPDDGPDAVARAVRCLGRLVQTGRLKPIKPGRSYLYSRDELLRYIATATAEFEPQSDVH